MSETVAAYLILTLFLVGAVSLVIFFGCLRLRYEKVNLKKTPLELIKKLALKEPEENILFIYPRSGWISAELVVKNHLGEEVGVIKFSCDSQAEILAGGDVYNVKTKTGMTLSHRAILYKSNEPSERRVLATHRRKEWNLGSSSFKLANGREIQSKSKGNFLPLRNKVCDIAENGKVVGRLFSRHGVGFLCLPTDIGLAERLFVILREIGRTPL